MVHGKNWEKIEELKKHLHENHKGRWAQFPNKEDDHFCNFCRDCQQLGSFCYFCGFRNAKSTTSYEYKETCKKIEAELLAQDGFNRIGEMVLENTYLPIVQLFVGLPLLLKNVSSLTSSDPHYTDLGLVLFSVGTSILSLALGITSLYFSQGKKSALAKDKATKSLYTIAMICQITSRLISLCVFGLLFFDKNGFALIWMMFACFAHVALVFFGRTILWWTDQQKSPRKFNFFYLVMGSLLSVFTFVKGRHPSEDKNDQQNQRESQRAKLLSRTLYFLLIVVEQALMYAGIFYACTYKHKDIEFGWEVFIIVMSILLLLGISFETTIHLFFNPVAEDREYFKARKLTFLAIIGLSLLSAILASIGVYANWLLWTVVPIFIVLTVIIVLLKCNVNKDSEVTLNFKHIELKLII